MKTPCPSPASFPCVCKIKSMLYIPWQMGSFTYCFYQTSSNFVSFHPLQCSLRSSHTKLTTFPKSAHSALGLCPSFPLHLTWCWYSQLPSSGEIPYLLAILCRFNFTSLFHFMPSMETASVPADRVTHACSVLTQHLIHTSIRAPVQCTVDGSFWAAGSSLLHVCILSPDAWNIAEGT